MVNAKKCVWEPVQRLIFVVDTALWQIEAPPEKVSHLKEPVKLASSSDKIQARKLASVIGKIISMELAFGPVSRFMTRSMYTVLESRHTWCDRLTLTHEACNELQFWASSLDRYNCQPIWRTPSAVRVVYSDARETGFGGYVVAWSLPSLWSVDPGGG